MKDTGLMLLLRSFGSLKRDIHLYIEDRVDRMTLDLSYKLFYQCYSNVLNYPKPSNEALIPRDMYKLKEHIAITLAKSTLLDSRYSSLFHLFWDHLYVYFDPYTGSTPLCALYRVNKRIFIDSDTSVLNLYPLSPDVYNV